jgi:hypothetical protein
MKGEVYTENPRALLEMKEAIENAIKSITSIEFSFIFANKIRRLDALPTNFICNLST